MGKERAINRGAWLAAWLLVCIASWAEAADPPKLESLFPKRMSLATEGGRLARTFLPPEVVSACRGNLSDLRILDSRGREVPYIIDSGRQLDAAIEKQLSFEPTVVSVERSRQEPEDAPAYWQESYVLSLAVEEGTPPEPAGEAWDLVLTINDREFVRTIRVEAETGETLASASLFRLANPLREQVRFALDPFESKTLRVEIEGEDGGYLEPVFRLESSIEIAGAARNEFVLEVLSNRTSEEHTTVELERPPGLIPDRLEVETSTAAFSRTFEVWDEGPGSDNQPLGRETVFRLRSAIKIEDTELRIRRARGDRLRVVIQNGDSPPLEGLAFRAVLRRPAILFTLPEGETSGVLYFGGGRAHRPRYDVAALLPALPASGPRGDLADQMYDPAKLAQVTLGAAETNPRFDPTPALGFAMRPGRELELARFTYRRNLTAPDSVDGLIRHELAVDTMARARADLGDIRIVDLGSRQWPYLIERGARFQTVELPVEERKIEGNKSVYMLALPASPMVVDEIVIDPPVSFFERSFLLEGGNPETAGSWLGLARGVLSRRQGDRRKVHIPTTGRLVTSLRLVVQDNEDAPLDLGAVELRYSATELFFAAPPGEYALLVGDSAAETPRYELEAVRSVVLAVDAAEATAGPLAKNPAYSSVARLSDDKGLQQVALWVALGLAVLVLGWFTFRLAREQPAAGE